MDEIRKINEKLKEHNMLAVDIVSPSDCLPQEVNARYMPVEKMQQLINNIKDEGKLESVPLVYKERNKYKIISGHHRVQAAREAGIEKILVMIGEPQNSDDIKSKQLSHNELSGLDDKTVLADIFHSIEDISRRIATGLNDEIAKIDYTSLNFRIGNFKEFTVMFLPEDVGIYDEAMDIVAAEMLTKPQTEIRLSSVKYYDKFANTIRRIKKAENIKSNGVALMRMVELAQQTMENVHE